MSFESTDCGMFEFAIRGLRSLAFQVATPLLVVLFQLPDAMLLGDCVWVTGQTVPLCGRILADTETGVVISLHGTTVPGEESPTQTIPRQQVRHVLKTIDPARLERLNPEVPEDYLRYAIELSAWGFDPSSQELAMQLAAIALHQATVHPRVPSMRVAERTIGLLHELAVAKGNSELAARVRELAHQLGMTAGGAGSTWGAPQSLQEQDHSLDNVLLEEIRRVRRRQTPASAPGEDIARIEQALKPWQHLLTPTEYHECRQAETIKPEHLLRLVRLELAIQALADDTLREIPETGWSVQSRLPAAEIPLPVTTRNLTPHSPDLCLWRNGVWVRDRPGAASRR